MICDVCLDALNAKPQTKPTKALKISSRDCCFRRHHESVESLMLSVDAGCYICASFYKYAGLEQYDLSTTDHRQSFEGGFTELQIRTDFFHSGFYFLVHGLEEIQGDVLKDLRFECYPPEEPSPSVRLKGRASRDSPAGQLHLAKTWFDQCITKHGAKCTPALGGNMPQEATYVPSRLLQVIHDANVTSNGVWRLVVTSEAQPNVTFRYATVSHRWNSEVQTKLLKENVDRLQEYQSDTLLTADLRRSLDVARFLGISYLWIDSLCIIQDSGDDWRHESLLMQDVYSNSLCNIVLEPLAPTPGRLPRSTWTNIKPQERCRPNVKWSRRDFYDNLAKGCTIDPLSKETLAFAWRNFVRSMRKLRASRNPLSVTFWDFFEQLLYQNQMTERGWIFQELILSPRVLHVYHDQLFWECGMTTACEWFPAEASFRRWTETTDTDASNLIRNTFRSLVLGFDKSTHTSNALSEDDYGNKHYVWEQLVERYSSCDLSFPKDRLVAIAGVAKALNAVCPDDYFAGLFRKSLPRSLLWIVKHSESSSPEITVSRAPSWAWTSTDGKVKFLTSDSLGDYTALGVVEEVCMDTIGPDPFGETKGGRLVLLGSLMAVTFSQDETPGLGNKPLPRIFLGKGSFQCLFDHVTEDTGEIRLFLPLICLTAARGNSFYGLLLSPTRNPSSDRDEFIRIGVLEVRPPMLFGSDRQHEWNQSSPIDCLDSWLALEKQRITIV